MEGGEDERRMRAFDELASHHGHAKIFAKKSACCCRAQACDDLGLHGPDLGFEPLAARVDLALRGRLVKAALAAQLPFEVLHCVGDVEVFAVDAGRLERAVEQAS